MKRFLKTLILAMVLAGFAAAQCGPNGHLVPAIQGLACAPNASIGPAGVKVACSATVTTNCTPQVNSSGTYVPTSMTWPAAPGLTVCTGTPCTAWGTSITGLTQALVGYMSNVTSDMWRK